MHGTSQSATSQNEAALSPAKTSWTGQALLLPAFSLQHSRREQSITNEWLHSHSYTCTWLYTACSHGGTGGVCPLQKQLSTSKHSAEGSRAVLPTRFRSRTALIDFTYMYCNVCTIKDTQPTTSRGAYTISLAARYSRLSARTSSSCVSRSPNLTGCGGTIACSHSFNGFQRTARAAPWLGRLFSSTATYFSVLKIHLCSVPC